MAATLRLPTTWKYSVGTLKVAIGWVDLGAYATNGVSLDPTDWGITVVQMVTFGGNPGGYVYEWDYTQKKVKVYTQGVTTGSTAIGGYTNGALVLTDAGVEGLVRLPNTAISTTYNFQPLKELSNGLSLSAYTLVVKMEGT